MKILKESHIDECEMNNGEENEADYAVDALYIAKTKMQWIPLPRHIGASAENITSLPPGLTLCGVKIIMDNTNKCGRLKFESKWKDLLVF